MNKEKIKIDDVKGVIGSKVKELYDLFKLVDYPADIALSVIMFKGYISYSLWENNSEKGNPDIVNDYTVICDE